MCLMSIAQLDVHQVGSCTACQMLPQRAPAAEDATVKDPSRASYILLTPDTGMYVWQHVSLLAATDSAF